MNNQFNLSEGNLDQLLKLLSNIRELTIENNKKIEQLELEIKDLKANTLNSLKFQVKDIHDHLLNN
ncbi:MAG: hypothetical protein R2771_14140 [Saprospiraceae bacterium]